MKPKRDYKIDPADPDTWPVVLHREDVKEILGINANRILEIFHQDTFPMFRLGTRMMVTRIQFLSWLEQQKAS